MAKIQKYKKVQKSAKEYKQSIGKVQQVQKSTKHTTNKENNGQTRTETAKAAGPHTHTQTHSYSSLAAEAQYHWFRPVHCSLTSQAWQHWPQQELSQALALAEQAAQQAHMQAEVASDLGTDRTTALVAHSLQTYPATARQTDSPCHFCHPNSRRAYFHGWTTPLGGMQIRLFQIQTEAERMQSLGYKHNSNYLSATDPRQRSRFIGFTSSTERCPHPTHWQSIAA